MYLWILNPDKCYKNWHCYYSDITGHITEFNLKYFLKYLDREKRWGGEEFTLYILAKINKKNQQSKLQKSVLFCTLAVVILCLIEIVMWWGNFDVLYGSLKHNSTTSVNSCTVAQSKLNILWEHNPYWYFLEVSCFT